jgi:hypothetical protein
MGDSGVMHGINRYKACPECGSTDHLVVENYSMMWHDGDVFCLNVEAHQSKEKVFVRSYDAG